jgi:hypothetical protein
MGRWWVRADLRHKMCSGGGTNETIGSRLALFNSLDDRGSTGRSGDVTINWVGGDGEGTDTTISHQSSVPPRSKHRPI